MPKTDDLLAAIFDRQLDLQVNTYGQDPSLLGAEARIQFVKDMIVATEDELHEALGEVGWKPWATSRHINREAYLGELIDALHFWVNLCLVVGATPEEVGRRYFDKAEKNARRQAEGYDGVAGKCPDCKRAYDDIGVDCQEGYCSMAAKS